LHLRSTALITSLKPQDRFPLWRCVDLAERLGKMQSDEAVRWKHGTFGLMERWGLEPDDFVPLRLAVSYVEGRRHLLEQRTFTPHVAPYIAYGFRRLASEDRSFECLYRTMAKMMNAIPINPRTSDDTS
jgi:hypothetical protein